MKRPEIEEWDGNNNPVPDYNPSAEMITLGNRYKAVRDYALALEREKVDRKQEFVSFVEHHEAQEKDWRHEKAELKRKDAVYDKANKDFQKLLITANKERAALEVRLKQAEDAFESMILRAFAEGRDYQSKYKKGIPNTRISARLKALKDLGKEV